MQNKYSLENSTRLCGMSLLKHLSIQDGRPANTELGVGQEERFFNKLEDDVSRIIQREKRREQYSNNQGQEVNTSTEHEPVSWQIEIQLSWYIMPQVLYLHK